MRQRNDTGRTLAVHTDPPQVVEPGGEIDCDTHVIGFTVLEATDAPVAGGGDSGDGGEGDQTSSDAPKKTTRSASKEATR